MLPVWHHIYCKDTIRGRDRLESGQDSRIASEQPRRVYSSFVTVSRCLSGNAHPQHELFIGAGPYTSSRLCSRTQHGPGAADLRGRLARQMSAAGVRSLWLVHKSTTAPQRQHRVSLLYSVLVSVLIHTL